MPESIQRTLNYSPLQSDDAQRSYHGFRLGLPSRTRAGALLSCRSMLGLRSGRRLRAFPRITRGSSLSRLPTLLGFLTF
jgi:hypothetical protein